MPADTARLSGFVEEVEPHGATPQHEGDAFPLADGFLLAFGSRRFADYLVQPVIDLPGRAQVFHAPERKVGLSLTLQPVLQNVPRHRRLWMVGNLADLGRQIELPRPCDHIPDPPQLLTRNAPLTV